MPTGSRRRGACQGCRTFGQFTPTEVLIHQGATWRYHHQLLCPVCRGHLEQLLSLTGAELDLPPELFVVPPQLRQLSRDA